ncbi:Hemerythrin HHE cation binding domain-containing protein [Caldanaerovirga acetigignens]|jgi:hemerythrin-like domain-containing protein|uniref:Hemerythrin HHE cation binding domain-containing protein n=1 Tax=Caldanaerovirga acetigignens TaxID=447595 RepID=A0A1M7HS79_9FIRM|nr:hemerythrin domain-containing protein [Caldanaerovirga acetigignens]SHM31268.1 Hemerythrin HHE cation binding domain-containing protein [Caldanaerovirga acetigignens]
MIGKLSGLLSLHLNSEDKYFYPVLLSHYNPEIRKKALEFTNETGDLSQKFANFKSEYMQAKNIKENPEKFIEDFSKINTALRQRIEREEKYLYPLI